MKLVVAIPSIALHCRAGLHNRCVNDWSRMTFSGKSAWCEESRYYGNTVTCGMLPTLRELASRGCNSRGSICLVPVDVEMDAASHLQMTLLEAYCREIGIKVLSVSKETIRLHLCPGSTDLTCVLISNDDSFFLPKWNWTNSSLRAETKGPNYIRSFTSWSILMRSLRRGKSSRKGWGGVLTRQAMYPMCLTSETTDNGYFIYWNI